MRRKAEEKTNRQLIQELAELRQRLTELEAAKAANQVQEEESLRLSEERYRTLFEQANDAILLTNLDDEIIDVNRRTCELLGYSHDELLAMKLPDFQAPEVRGQEGSVIRSELEQYVGTPFESIDIHRDGSRIPVEVTVSPLRGKGESLVLCIVRDITERVRAEEEIRLRNRELELLSLATRAFSSTLELDQVLSNTLNQTCHLLGVVAASIWLIDREVNTDEENPGELICRQAVGPKSETVRGWRLPPGEGIAGWVARSGESVIVPDAQADDRHFKGVDKQTGVELRSILSVPMRAKQKVIGVLQVVDTEVGRFDTSDRTLLESLAASASIAIENARLYKRAQQEIAERIRVEDEIRQRNRELTMLNQIIAASAASQEPEAVLETACRELAHAFDVPQAAATLLNDEKSAAIVVAEFRAKGRPAALNQVIPVEGNPSFQYLLTRQAPLVVDDAQNDPRLAPIHELLRQRGTVSLLILPLIVDGEVIGSLGLDAIESRDFSAEEVSLAWSVTDQIAIAIKQARLREQVQRQTAELERKVNERTADLSRANAELARASRMKDEFLANMSHELRTPLNAILGMSEVLSEQVYGPLNAEQLNALRHIEEGGRHLLDLITDILDLSKIEAGKLELQIGAVSVEEVCQASLRFVKQMAQKKGIKTFSSLDQGVTNLQADERRLKQILVNLLTNAVKFTPNGGQIGLELVGDEAERVVRFTIWDTGIGISEEEMDRLFRPFAQLDASLTRQQEGAGLGLALVARLAEMHCGSVSLESEVGSGSRFTVSLPWSGAVETAEPVTGAEPCGTSPTDRANIGQALVIEDSPTAADRLSRYLVELGIETTVHTRGEGVLEKVKGQRPEVVILDLILPDQSGWEVLAQLKAEPATQAIPVLIVSVLDERDRGLAKGAAEYLVKPVTRSKLQQTLQQILTPGLKDPRALVIASDQPGEQIAGDRPLILLAEDNVANITAVMSFLEAKGYQVLVAQNGAEAVERAREERPQVILMDIQMPVMDGLEAMRRIREDDGVTAVPIIALTALAMRGDRERCLEAGADEYLPKPVSMRKLLEVIEAQLSKQKATRSQLPAVSRG